MKVFNVHEMFLVDRQDSYLFLPLKFNLSTKGITNASIDCLHAKALLAFVFFPTNSISCFFNLLTFISVSVSLF